MTLHTVATQQQIATLDEEIATLEKRLTIGWAAIDDAIAAGRDVRSWEDRWMALLLQYERAFDRRAALRALLPPTLDRLVTPPRADGAPTA